MLLSSFPIRTHRPHTHTHTTTAYTHPVLVSQNTHTHHLLHTHTTTQTLYTHTVLSPQTHQTCYTHSLLTDTPHTTLLHTQQTLLHTVTFSQTPHKTGSTQVASHRTHTNTATQLSGFTQPTHCYTHPMLYTTSQTLLHTQCFKHPHKHCYTLQCFIHRPTHKHCYTTRVLSQTPHKTLHTHSASHRHTQTLLTTHSASHRPTHKPATTHAECFVTRHAHKHCYPRSAFTSETHTNTA
ncbi:hypothetical protein GDO86_011842 [Hymenochirus boettgeri]|uniref:Uncharacterized protein n=1 Tax=Hymenochirus boettgeri TaxID=247094 RepID=A0A8T2JL19_9PIPI|nr:hypothetical protein GDO86_011842 [Hymenochirus boettgeri]